MARHNQSARTLAEDRLNLSAMSPVPPATPAELRLAAVPHRRDPSEWGVSERAPRTDSRPERNLAFAAKALPHGPVSLGNWLGWT